MRVKKSYLFAIAILGVVALYFIVRSALGAVGEKPEAEAKAAETTASVQVMVAPAQVRTYQVVLRGRTQATRSVAVRSETSGVVAATPIAQGVFVQRGAVLCRLSVDARKASLDQARAALRSSQLKQQASASLAAKGFRSQTQVLQDRAELDSATAAVRQAEIALSQIDIRAPFAGVFDHRDAEVGAYLSPGQPCGTMIELNPLLIVGDVPETEAGKLKVGAAASATLLSGEVLRGHVRFVARDADPQTRTYHVEVIAPNPSLKVRSGLSSELRIDSGTGPAHLIPVSTLVLDAAGRQGVRYLLPNNRVAFAPVTQLEETPKGVWVTGLSGDARVITVGQSYVSEGEVVKVGAH